MIIKGARSTSVLCGRLLLFSSGSEENLPTSYRAIISSRRMLHKYTDYTNSKLRI